MGFVDDGAPAAAQTAPPPPINRMMISLAAS
jgi:hypothetical protein